MEVDIVYVLVVSFNHIGDYNQAKQVERTLKDSVKIKYIDIEIDDPDKDRVDQINEYFNQIQGNILHFFGEKGLKLLQVSKWVEKSSAFKVIQVHQYMEALKEIKADYLIIPKGASDDVKDLDISNKYYLESMIFEKVQPPKLLQLFQNSVVSQELSKEWKYLIVMLSGDAPDKNNTMKYFTKQSADNLLQWVEELLKTELNEQYHIIVQNGPRTGKHDPDTGKQVCLHKYQKNQAPEGAVDQISQYFVDKLKAKVNCPVHFFNFAFQMEGNKRTVISYYKPLLHLARKQGNIFMFPMQSISMCSELPYYINKDSLICYQTSSVNQDHLKHVHSGFDKGLYCITQEGSMKIKKPANQSSGLYDQTRIVLDNVLNIWNKSCKTN